MISGIIKVEVSVKRREGAPSHRFSFVRGRVRLRLATSSSWRAEQALFGREAADRDRRSREKFGKSRCGYT